MIVTKYIKKIDILIYTCVYIYMKIENRIINNIVDLFVTSIFFRSNRNYNFNNVFYLFIIYFFFFIGNILK